jgi:hypothetical protein
MRIALACLLVACGGETTNIDGGVDAQAEAEAGDFGSCGKPAHDCLCACSDGGDCNSCYQTYPTCVTCIDDAVTTCCPNEYPAYTKCIDDSQKAAPDGGPPACTPSDTACQNAFCQSQAAALQTCLSTQTCKTANAKCTGTCP